MGLINLQTNLKSLKFGNDRAHGGSSKQPYIQTPIPEQLGDFGALDTDFLLRGGSRAVTDSVKDVERLGKYFTDVRNPSGLLFVAKQNLLSRTAVRTQASGILNEGIYTPLSTLIEAGGVAFGLHVNKQGLNPFDGPGSIGKYNDIVNPELGEAFSIKSKDRNRLVLLTSSKITNTLSANPLTTGISPLPTNILTYGGGPGSILGIGKTNIKFADQRTGINSFNKKEEFEIRKNLSLGNNLSRTKIDQYLDNNGSYKYFPTDPYQQINRFFKLSTLNGFSSSPYWKDLYFDSLYLLDQQTASKNQNRIARDVPNETLSTNYIPEIATDKNTSITYTQAQLNKLSTDPNSVLSGESFIIGRYNSTAKIGDFRKKLKNIAEDSPSTYQKQLSLGLIPNAPNYTDKNIEKRVNLGNPGNTTVKNLLSYTAGKDIEGLYGAASEDSYDKINRSPIVLTKGLDSNTKFDEDKNDLVKFAISVLDTKQNNVKSLHFRAFLNQISDQYSADWNPTRYIGRGENFYTYAGFDRKVSLSWTVAAQSKIELIPMYKKLNYLASICAPNYSENGYMQGNIVKLTVGGYFFQQPGIITGFSYEMNDDNATWEIGIDDNGEYDSSVKELPHLIKVSGFNFIPIHDFVPRLVQNPNVGTKERYIALQAGTSNYDVADE